MQLIIILFLIGLLLIFIELFLPAGGLLGLIGAICLICSAVIAFRDKGFDIGFAVSIVGVIATVILIAAGLVIFPQTPIGRHLTLRKSIDQRGTAPLHPELVSQEGVALSDLRPAGVVEIDGKKFDVVTSGEMIDTGSCIVVKAVEGLRIVVRQQT